MIIASNRLPVSIKKEKKRLTVSASVGGLATGLKSYHKKGNSVWVGWPGINTEEDEKAKVTGLLEKSRCHPVFLSQNLIENYYDGFSNSTLWPLFHYFMEFSESKEVFWEAYVEVNQLFAKEIIKKAAHEEIVWIHDYQLLLLPQILKSQRPDLTIGFFLHIPFPSFEVFRILPWRKEIIQGLLGADLIGFHTYDYARHFISSVKRLLGFEVEFNRVHLENRHVYIDVFPMGIDYDKFKKKALEIQSKPIQERSKEHQDIDRFLLGSPDRKLILSIDRLDYTKGIPARLNSFRRFLSKYPEYKEKVSLVLLSVPSRVEVELYQNLKSEVEQLVGSINGQFGTLNWNPIIFFYRSLPFENLIELYSSADIALLTPLRDGMNLVAKEFVASKTNHKGVLVLSEMAGATRELGEAISVNPNNIEEVADAIYQALKMSDKEQSKSIKLMQTRIERYNVHKWAKEFIDALNKTRKKQEEHLARKASDNVKSKLKKAYKNAESSVLFLDYDGTLQKFFDIPNEAVPDDQLIVLLDKLASHKQTTLIIISGRDKDTLEKWFGKKDYILIAEHGAWIKTKQEDWIPRQKGKSTWKSNVRKVLDSYVDRTPGSLLEEKSHSLVWHYRKADPELGMLRALELRSDISNLIINQNLEILEGSKVIEIKVQGINKGSAAVEFLQKHPPYEFIMAMGDDWTDEFLFQELPESSVNIKVGTDKSVADYYVSNYLEVRELLQSLT